MEDYCGFKELMYGFYLFYCGYVIQIECYVFEVGNWKISFCVVRLGIEEVVNVDICRIYFFDSRFCGLSVERKIKFGFGCVICGEEFMMYC